MKDLVLNFTNRVDLLPVDVSATYSVIENLCTLKLGWQLGHYGFESTAEIVVDIRVKGSTEARRLNIGKIDNGFGEKTFELANMRNPELMELRFKVVHSNFGEMPMLRASLDRITPVDVNPNNRSKSFFKIVKQDVVVVQEKIREISNTIDKDCKITPEAVDLLNQAARRKPTVEVEPLKKDDKQ
jgi:hypothetical protein